MNGIYVIIVLLSITNLFYYLHNKNLTISLKNCSQTMFTRRCQRIYKLGSNVTTPTASKVMIEFNKDHNFNFSPNIVAAQSSNIVLLIVIPTLERSNGVTYIQETLVNLIPQINQQNSDGGGCKVKLFVNTQVEFMAFQSMRKAFSSQCIQFAIERAPRVIRSFKPQKRHPLMSFVSESVGAQMDAFIKAINLATSTTKDYTHVMFMEDDFLLCPHSLQLIYRTLVSATSNYPNWSSARFSTGFNGIVVNQRDINDILYLFCEFGYYFPIDDTYSEWVSRGHLKHLEELDPKMKEMYERNKDRTIIAYRFQLFLHLGIHSSLNHQHQVQRYRCFDTHFHGDIWTIEEFDFKRQGCATRAHYSPCDFDNQHEFFSMIPRNVTIFDQSSN